MSFDIKQVIIIRKDLKMRRGKEIAQGSHSSIKWLVERVNSTFGPLDFSEEEKIWMTGNFAKICLQVNSEQELRDIYQKSLDIGLESHLIVDAGKTEFNGVPTPTCCAIGPDSSERIDKITGDLKLY